MPYSTQRFQRPIHHVLGSIVRLSALGGALAMTGPAIAQELNTPPATAQSQLPLADFSTMVEQKLPGVVGILTTAEAPPQTDNRPQLPRGLEEFFGLPDLFGQQQPTPDTPRRMQGQGSGFIISEDGYVVTNNHVVAGADEIEVRLEDGRQAAATLIGTDPATDIALLKLDGMEDLPWVEWGDSENLKIGEWVVAIGNPFGLGGTVTAGIVSARSRNINAGPYDDFLQTDAAINRGNSGGPLFDADGFVVGVNTAIFSPTGGSVGIGFAVPSAVAQNVVNQLRENGQVERGWLGVQIQPLTEEIASALGLEDSDGTLIANVSEGAPAAEAGLQAGDVVLALNGESVESPRDLSFAIAEMQEGSEAEVTIFRDGQEQAITVEIGLLPIPQAEAGTQPEAQPSDGPRIGLSLAPLDREVRQQLGIDPGIQGAVIAAVQNGSPAADAGLRRGDVVVEANGQDVTSPQDLIAVVEGLPEEGGTVLMRLFSEGVFAYRVVRLDTAVE